MSELAAHADPCLGLRRFARIPWNGGQTTAPARAEAAGIKRKVDRPTGLPNIPQPI
jgi:hypothetical protein